MCQAAPGLAHSRLIKVLTVALLQSMVFWGMVTVWFSCPTVVFGWVLHWSLVALRQFLCVLSLFCAALVLSFSFCLFACSAAWRGGALLGLLQSESAFALSVRLSFFASYGCDRCLFFENFIFIDVPERSLRSLCHRHILVAVTVY